LYTERIAPVYKTPVFNDDFDEEDDGFGSIFSEALSTVRLPVDEDEDDAEAFQKRVEEAFLSPLQEDAVPTRNLDLEPRPFDAFNLPAGFWQELPLVWAKKLLEEGPYPLASINTLAFSGDGIYALYYQGGLPFYEAIRSPGSTCPIYIGKSGQSGRTSGREGCSVSIHGRLRQHLKSIQEVRNLSAQDFTFRFIVLQHTEQVGLAESLLLKLFQPAWNSSLSGFGSRPGFDKRCENTSRASPWDTLHPGRRGSGKKPRSRSEVEEKLLSSLRQCRFAYEKALASLEKTNNLV
jgi:hypothetical protein